MGDERDVWARVLELGLAADGAGPDPRARGQLFKRCFVFRNPRVARIFAFWDSSDDDARRKVSCQIFQRMHRQVNAFIQKRFVDFFREERFQPPAGGRFEFFPLITAGGDQDAFDLQISKGFSQTFGDPLGLRLRECALACSQAQRIPSPRALSPGRGYG